MIVEENYGIHKNTKIVKFGNGSVRIDTAIVDIEDKTFNDVLLSSDYTGRKNGDSEFRSRILTANDLTNIDIALRFDSIKSIDILIKQLNVAKDNFIKGITQKELIILNQ